MDVETPVQCGTVITRSVFSQIITIDTPNHSRHPIPRPHGRAIGCLLWFWSPIHVLLLSSQNQWWYRDKLDRVITALDCTVKCKPNAQCFWCPTAALHWIFNALRPRQYGRRFADDIFKRIFLNDRVWISIKISLKFILRVQLTISEHYLR